MVERLTQRGLQGRRKLQRGWSSKPTYGPAWTGVSEMSHLGLLVNAGRKGSESLWMSSADYLATGRNVPDPEDCMIELVSKYIECNGTVCRGDIVKWLYLLKKDVVLTIANLDKHLIKEDIQ